MAFNVPTVDTDRYSFGPATVKIGPAGTTPTTDVGSVRSDATFTVERETLDVNQGSPATLQKQFIVSESASLSVSGIEWNLNNLQLALGAGTTSSPGAGVLLLDFGGDPDTAEVALEVTHVLPAGTTVVIRIWRASPAGGMEVEFGDDIHEFPYEFNALEATTDWAGQALGAGARLFQIEHQTA